MGVLDLNNDGKVDIGDVVFGLKGVVGPVVLPIAENAIRNEINEELFADSTEWRDSCRRTCSGDWSPAPAAVKALSAEDRDYIIDMVGEKYEREIAAMAEGLIKRVVRAIAEKLGIKV